MTTCKQCKAQFEITDADRAFYKKMDVPDPVLCPACRYQRRLAHRNEWTMYSRKCDATGKNIVAIYPQNSPYKIYDQVYWRSDAWDARKYGRDFDFNRPFFEQFQELRMDVPRLSLNSPDSVNSEFTNQSQRNKDCYMCVACNENEMSMYSMWSQKGENLVDTYSCTYSKWCYDSLKCNYSSNIFWSMDTDNSNSMYFCYDCRGCNDCFMSAGLRTKSYVWENVQLTKEEYHKRFAELKLGSYTHVQELKKQAGTKWAQAIRKYADVRKCEDSTGDDLFETKNVKDTFHAIKSEDSRYCQDAKDMKDSWDCTEVAVEFELNYETHGAAVMYRNFVTNLCSYLKFSSYCDSCFFSENLFGCVGVQHVSYCIFNKQYTKEEYEVLVPKIIAHMKSTGEWGHYFPEKYSVFGYNETTANEYFPLAKEEVLKREWQWSDSVPGTYGKETIAWNKIPDSIKDVDESICKEIFACAETGKNFKVIKQELDFYKKMNVPLPRLHPDVRRTQRNALRNPRKLWHRQCMCKGQGHVHPLSDNFQCPNKFETTYAPDRPEKVFCEVCYQKEVI